MVEGCAPQRLQPMETHCCYVCHLLPPSLVVACVSTPTQPLRAGRPALFETAGPPKPGVSSCTQQAQTLTDFQVLA